MRNAFILSCFGLSLWITPAMALSNSECETLWQSADTNADGTLSDNEARRYMAALRVAEKPATGGTLTKDAFLEHCKAGIFNAMKVEAGAPLPGANSFTETQAKERAMAAGFNTISALVKDANGVWRGTANDGAESVSIAIDYKGNVVAN